MHMFHSPANATAGKTKRPQDTRTEASDQRGRIVRAVAACLLFCVAWPSAASDPRPAMLSCATGSLRTDIELGPAPVRIGIVPDQNAALLHIEERGRDIEWRVHGDERFQPVAGRPPRLGIKAIDVHRRVDLELRRSGTNELPATVRLELDCRPNAEQRARAHCLTVAEDVDSFDAVELFASTRLPVCRAFLLHAAASAASLRGDARNAERLYGAAIEMWSRAGDRARQGAAQLGWAERLSDLGRHEEAIAASEASARNSREAGIDYFAARAQLQRCTSISYARSSAAASECYRRQVDGFIALGEISEAANVRYSMASIAEQAGRLDRAQADVDAALALGEARISPLVTGRLRYLEGRLALAQGRIAAALAALDRALASLDQAGNRHWQANVYLLAAHVYASLAASEEAGIFLDRARSYYRESGAVPRLAAATLFDAQLRAVSGRDEAARQAAIEAAQLFDRLGMTERSVEAWLLAHRLGGDERFDVWRRLAPIIDALDPVPERLRIDIELARIRAAIAADGDGGPRNAADRFAALAEEATSMEQMLHAREAQVRALLDSGDAAEALRVADALVERQFRLVDTLRVPALRHLAVRRARRIGALWIDTVLALPPDRRPPASVLRDHLSRLQGTHALSPRIGDAGSARDGLDAALAQAVLPDRGGDPTSEMLAAQRSLLGFYAASKTTDAIAAPERRSLANVDTAIPAGVVRLSFALGDRQAFALVESGNGGTALYEIAPPGAIREAASALVALAYQRDSAVTTLAAAARTLSSRIFPPALAGDDPPAELWIESDETLASVPFALLSWPGRDWPLVESTAISHRLGTEGHLTPSAHLDVLVAAEPEGTEALVLPRLYGAAVEHGLLVSVAGTQEVRAYTGAAAGRAQLEALLSQPGSWVHVAAHGVSRAGIQGLAGLWLAPARGMSRPEFVSWLSLADRPLAASLVVLNACQLAQTGAAVSASSSFAAALAAAGVRHVVAARWQVSDSASAVWVPAFYAALHADDAMSPARAVREAQLALRRSRAFRHPFYWSGLSHIQGIEPAPLAGRQPVRVSDKQETGDFRHGSG